MTNVEKAVANILLHKDEYIRDTGILLSYPGKNASAYRIIGQLEKAYELDLKEWEKGF